MIRLDSIVRNNAFTGAREDDMAAFFRRSVWDVHPADVWRFYAVCGAVREIHARPT
ncbi:MAG: hypothetical protein ABI445_21920 [Polyangia bacterium]